LVGVTGVCRCPGVAGVCAAGRARRHGAVKPRNLWRHLMSLAARENRHACCTAESIRGRAAFGRLFLFAYLSRGRNKACIWIMRKVTAGSVQCTTPLRAAEHQHTSPSSIPLRPRASGRESEPSPSASTSNPTIRLEPSASSTPPSVNQRARLAKPPKSVLAWQRPMGWGLGRASGDARNTLRRMDLALQAWCKESIDDELDTVVDCMDGAYVALNVSGTEGCGEPSVNPRRPSLTRDALTRSVWRVAAAGGEVELPSGVKQVALFSDSYRCSEEECVLDEHCELPEDEDESYGLLDWLLSGWRYQGLSG
jgi:hypothetical protein